MTILVKVNWRIEKHFKNIKIALIYYNKLERLIRAIKKLTKYCKIFVNS